MTGISTRIVSCAILASLLSLAAGCGGGVKSREGLVQVTGSVTLDGKAVTTGTISFITQDGKEAFTSPLDSSGKYQLGASPSSPGALPGEYKVVVVATEGTPQRGMGEKGAIPEMKSLVPEKYRMAETSGLTASVKSGQSNSFDFPLKSN